MPVTEASGTCADSNVVLNAFRARATSRTSLRVRRLPGAPGDGGAGVGVALIPTLAIVSSRSDVVVLPLRGRAPVRRILAAVREGEENLLVEHMIDALRDAAHALAGRPALHAVA